MLSQTIINELINKAKSAMSNSYSPYSKFAVGSVLLTEDEKIFTGCNVENASFGATVCAERVALFNAISKGEKNFKAIAIISSSDDFCTPCGICRQCLIEFSKDMLVICCNNKGEYKLHKINELLPSSFLF